MGLVPVRFRISVTEVALEGQSGAKINFTSAASSSDIASICACNSAFVTQGIVVPPPAGIAAGRAVSTLSPRGGSKSTRPPPVPLFRLLAALLRVGGEGFAVAVGEGAAGLELFRAGAFGRDEAPLFALEGPFFVDLDVEFLQGAGAAGDQWDVEVQARAVAFLVVVRDRKSV